MDFPQDFLKQPAKLENQNCIMELRGKGRGQIHQEARPLLRTKKKAYIISRSQKRTEWLMRDLRSEAEPRAHTPF